MKNTQLFQPHIDLNEESPDLASPHYDAEIFPDTGEAVFQSAEPDWSAPGLAETISQARLSTGLLSSVTGAFGLPGQLIDLPGFYSSALLHVARIARFYGFDPTHPGESRFALQLLAIGHLPTQESRLKELTKIYVPGKKTLYAGELAALITSRASVLSIYKFAAKALSGRFRSLLPGIGAATNVAANLKTMEAILETAVTAYHRRMMLRDSLAQD